MTKAIFVLFVLCFCATGNAQTPPSAQVRFKAKVLLDGPPRPASRETLLTNVNSVHAADLDGDNDLDVLASFNRGGLCWLENLGNGQFSKLKHIYKHEGSVVSICTMGRNADGRLDIAVGLGIGSFALPQKSVVLLENQGNESFKPKLLLNESEYSSSGRVFVKAADFDKDMKVDIVAAFDFQSEQEQDRIVWFKNLGNGAFSDQRVIDSAQVAIDDDLEHYKGGAINICDVNGDGLIDVLSGFTWFKNNNGQSFSPHQIAERGGGANPTSISPADLDNDRDMDLFMSWIGGVSVFVNDGAGGFTGHSVGGAPRPEGGFVSISPTDINGDKRMDVPAALFNGGRIMFFENLGDLKFSPQKITKDPNLVFGSSVFTADFDNDKDSDVLSGFMANGGMIILYENIGLERELRSYAYVTNYSSTESNKGSVSFIDIKDHKKTNKSVPVGRGPRGLASSPNGDFVYVANGVAGSVSVIRNEDQSVIHTFDRITGPIDVAFTDDGEYVYVAANGSAFGMIHVIKTKSNAVVATIKLPLTPDNKPMRPQAIGFVSTPKPAFFVPCYDPVTKLYGAIYVIDHQHTLDTISGSPSEKAVTITFEPTPHNMIPAAKKMPNSITTTADSRYAFVTNEGTHSLSVIDIEKRKRIEFGTAGDVRDGDIQVGMHPHGVAVHSDQGIVHAFTSGGLTNKPGFVSVIDINIEQRSADRKQDVVVGKLPIGIAATPDGKFVYVANYQSNNVSVIDTGSRAVIQTIHTGMSPWAVVVGASR